MANWSEKLNQMTQDAISKSKEVAGVAKLTLEMNSLNQNIKTIQTEVGAYVLENGLLMEDASVAEWASKVAALKADIEADAEKINELKNVSICPGCGEKVSRNSKFCDKCGTAIVLKVSDPVGEDEVVVDANYTAAGEQEACCGAAQTQEGCCETAGEQEACCGAAGEQEACCEKVQTQETCCEAARENSEPEIL